MIQVVTDWNRVRPRFVGLYEIVCQWGGHVRLCSSENASCGDVIIFLGARMFMLHVVHKCWVVVWIFATCIAVGSIPKSVIIESRAQNWSFFWGVYGFKMFEIYLFMFIYLYMNMNLHVFVCMYTYIWMWIFCTYTCMCKYMMSPTLLAQTEYQVV